MLFCGESSFIQGTATVAGGDLSRQGQTTHLLRLNPTEPSKKWKGGEFGAGGGQMQDFIPCKGEKMPMIVSKCLVGTWVCLQGRGGIWKNLLKESPLLRGSGPPLDIKSSDVMFGSKQAVLFRAQVLSSRPYPHTYGVTWRRTGGTT